MPGVFFLAERKVTTSERTAEVSFSHSSRMLLVMLETWRRTGRVGETRSRHGELANAKARPRDGRAEYAA